MVSGATRIAVLINPADVTNTETMVNEIGRAGRGIGLQLEFFNASNVDDISIRGVSDSLRLRRDMRYPQLIQCAIMSLLAA